MLTQYYCTGKYIKGITNGFVDAPSMLPNNRKIFSQLQLSVRSLGSFPNCPSYGSQTHKGVRCLELRSGTHALWFVWSCRVFVRVYRLATEVQTTVQQLYTVLVHAAMGY